MVSISNGQTKFGVQAGLNLSKLRTQHGGNTVDGHSSVTNFHLKGYADIFVTNNISVQPGLSLMGRGGKEADPITTYNYQSLDIPVNILYHIPLKGNSIFLGAGPFAGLNLSGKIKFNEGGSEDLEFGPILEASEDEWKRIDYGVNFLTGYKISKGFLLNLGYSIGLADIDPLPDWKRNSKIWSFGLGYEF